MTVATVQVATKAIRQDARFKPENSAFNACLDPLLRALHWRGTPRQVAEASALRDRMDLLDLRNAMASFGFASHRNRTRLADLDVRLLPSLFLPDGGDPIVVLGAGDTPGTLVGFDGESGSTATLERIDCFGTAYFFRLDDQPARAPAASVGGWFRTVVRRFEPTLMRLLALSFLLSLLALAPAFFVYAVYDAVLASGNRETLVYLTGGVVFALFCDIAVRVLRDAVLAHVGARLDFLVGTATVAKLLSLPMARLEKTAVGSQIARLREYENLRSFFVGPLAIVFLQLPFVLVFLIAIALIGGALVLVPVVLALVLVGVGLVCLRYARSAIDRSVTSHGELQTLLVDMLSNLRVIKAGASEAIWLERFRERSADLSFRHMRQAGIAATTANIAQAINFIAGAATLAFGALLAMNGAVTVGALIASMVLVWRVLAPVQTLFVTLSRFEGIRDAVRGVDQMMALPSEAASESVGSTAARRRRVAGRITFNRVVLRYSAHHEPALAGVAFDIKPGQIVAITGGNGSGKSTILKLVAGLYQPQGGAVLIDGVDTRQLNPITLRQSIAYLPQQSDLFNATIEENLRFANPTATVAELQDACAEAGALTEIQALAMGLATPVDARLPVGLVRKLALARAYITDAGIMLLDEPSPILDASGGDLILRQLEALRGRTTVLLVTHRPDYVRAADRVLVLAHGAVVHDGSPKALMTKLAGGSR